MKVNLHFVMLEDLSGALPSGATGESAVARIEIIRECSPGELDFDDLRSDSDPQA